MSRCPNRPCTPLPAVPPLTSSLRATWQMCTGRWYSWATIRTAATVCRSACATMGRCCGHCSKCCGDNAAGGCRCWEPGLAPWQPLPAAAHLHPQRHVVHPQAGEGVVQVHLEARGCPGQGAQRAGVLRGRPQEEGEVAAGAGLGQLWGDRRWVPRRWVPGQGQPHHGQVHRSWHLSTQEGTRAEGQVVAAPPSPSAPGQRRRHQ